MPSLPSAYSSCPERAANSSSLTEECSEGMNISRHEPASQEGLVMQRFPEGSGESEEGRIHNSSQPVGQSVKVGLLLGPLSWWCGLGLIQLWLFYPLYFHWIPRSSQLTFHRRSAVLLFRALGDTQVLVQSLESRERAWTFRSGNGQSGKIYGLYLRLCFSMYKI